MGLEFELKYQATPAQQAAVRARFSELWQTITMETTYYDTPEDTLSTRRYTLRKRLENGISVCTLKTPAAGFGRCEWEVLSDSIESAIPELCKLSRLEGLPQLLSPGVQPICGARFTRYAATVKTAEAVVELALDSGILFAETAQVPLCEIEIELKSGSQDAAVTFAKALAKEYGLTIQPKSKFKRALDLRKDT